MPDVSAKMKKGIKLCEECLNIHYEGKTFEDAKKFLDQNLTLLQNKDIREFRQPSQKMLDAIAIIQQRTGDTYSGHNMKDASEYIDKHYAEVFGNVHKKGKGGKKK